MSEYQKPLEPSTNSGLQGWVRYTVNFKVMLTPLLLGLTGVTAYQIFRADTAEERMTVLAIIGIVILVSSPIIYLIFRKLNAVAVNLDENKVRINREEYPISYLQDVQILARNIKTATPYYNLIFTIQENESKVPIRIPQGVALTSEKFEHLSEAIKRSGIRDDEMQEVYVEKNKMLHRVGKSQVLQLLAQFRS